MKFKLNERLAAGGFEFGKLGICRILLKDNAVFPWFILVPEVDDSVTELHHLSANDFASVSFTIRQLSEFLDHQFKPTKVNVGAIGNIVRQLHIHLIARYETDSAWPGVVWSCSDKEAYTKDKALEIHQAYQNYFTSS
ncbi:MAG: HIT domain-containing protein [Akkermansiaceae bacterium]